MQREIQEIQGLATKYSRAELGRMVQLGLLDPQKAMMAGMMIQRIEQQNAQPPQTTVAQDLLGMPPVPNQPAPPQAPQGMPPMPPAQGGMPPSMPQQGPGIEALPAGNVGNYADGGIVAFADKGAVKEEEGGSPEYQRAIREMDELAKKEAANKPKKRDNISFIKDILKTHGKSPLPLDKKDLTDNPLNFNMGKGLWKGTYATPYDQIIVDAAKEADVDPRVLWRLLYTESKFDPKAQSYKGKKYGYGMAQIAALHGIPEEDLENPEHSIKAGAWILKRFLKAAGGNYRKALEGYKGAVSEAGKAAMAPHIDLVLGESTLSPPAKKKKLPPLKKGEIASYPVPMEGMDVKRDFGEPTPSELAALKTKKKKSKVKSNVEDVYDIGSGNFIMPGWDTSMPLREEEYEQEGAPHYGGWFTPDEAAGLPEFNYAHGGITSLAHGGYIPRYAGEGSQVTSSAVPMPDMQSYDPTMPTYAGKRWEDLPEYKKSGNKLAGSLDEFFSNLYGTVTQGIPSQGTTRVDPKTGEPISLGEFMRRAEAERTEDARRSLPPIAKPTPKEATAEEKAAAKDVGARMPPVEVRPEPESKEEAPKEERKSKEENYRGLKLPGFDKYNVDIPVYTGDMPQQSTPEDEYEKRTAQEKRVGYDQDLFNKMISNIESKKGNAATEKDKAIGEAIMIASMKLLGARRGQEFQMLSEGAQEGLKAYQASMRDFRNRQEKLDDRIETLRLADMQARRSGAESDIARAQRQQELYYKAQQEFAKAKNEAAYRGAYLATTMRDTDANIFGNIAAHQISASASRSAQAPAAIQLAERVAKEKGISFTDAYSLVQNMNVDPKEEMKLREKYANDFMLRRQYKTVNDFLRAMGVGGGGGGGSLQAGPDGKMRYVPGGQ